MVGVSGQTQTSGVFQIKLTPFNFVRVMDGYIFLC